MLTVISEKVVPGSEIWKRVKENMVKEGQGPEGAMEVASMEKTSNSLT